jgi:hypothetical protein
MHQKLRDSLLSRIDMKNGIPEIIRNQLVNSCRTQEHEEFVT